MFNLKNMLMILLMGLAASFGGVKAYIDHRLAQELDHLTTSIDNETMMLEYAQVNSSLLGAVVIRQVNLTSIYYPTLFIDTVTIHQAHQFYELERLPKKIKITVRGLQISIPETASPTPPIVSTLGYAPYYVSAKEWRGLAGPLIKADLDLTGQWTRENLHLSGTLNAQVWGQLKFATHLTQIPRFSQWDSQNHRIQWAEFKLHYINIGLIDNLFSLLAQRNQTSVSQLKQNLIHQLSRDFSQFDLDSSVLASLKAFIQTPNTLTLYLKPNPPLPINALWHTTSKRFGLKMTTTEWNE